MGQRTNDEILVASRITVWIQGLFSGLVTGDLQKRKTANFSTL